MRKSTRDSEKGNRKANCFLLKFHSKDKKEHQGQATSIHTGINIFFFNNIKYMGDFQQTEELRSSNNVKALQKRTLMSSKQTCATKYHKDSGNEEKF